MSLSMKQNRALTINARPSKGVLRTRVVLHAKEAPSIDPAGFISNDNSGKGYVVL